MVGRTLDSRQQAIRRLVRKTYETPEIVSRYTQVGLWPAEEILVLDYVPDGARIADIGCGAGRTTVALAEIGLRVTGIDISRQMVAAAVEQARFAGVAERTDFHVMDAMSLALSDDQFDVVFFTYNGIELLPGRAGKLRAIGEFARILKPDGLLIFCVHSPFAINPFIAGRLGAFLRFAAGCLLGIPVREQEAGERFLDEEWEEARYLQILPSSTLESMLVECGLEVIYHNTRKRIERGRRPNRFSSLEDSERFFVARRC